MGRGYHDVLWEWNKVKGGYDEILEIVCHYLVTLFASALPEYEVQPATKLHFKNLEAIIYVEAATIWYQYRSKGIKDTYIYGMQQCIDLQIKRWLRTDETELAQKYCTDFKEVAKDLPEGLWPHEVAAYIRENSSADVERKRTLLEDLDALKCIESKKVRKACVRDIVPRHLIGLRLAEADELDCVMKILEKKGQDGHRTHSQRFSYSAVQVKRIIKLFESSGDLSSGQLQSIGVPDHFRFWTEVVRKYFQFLFAGGHADYDDHSSLEFYHLFNYHDWFNNLDGFATVVCPDK